jgi:hypothetical protein
MLSALFPAYGSVKHPAGHDELFHQLRELKILLEKAELVCESDQDSVECDGCAMEPDGATTDQTPETANSLETFTACLMDLLPSMEKILIMLTLSFAMLRTVSR